MYSQKYFIELLQAFYPINLQSEFGFTVAGMNMLSLSDRK